MFIVARQAEQVINSFEAIANFQIIVDRKGDRDEMNLKVELKREPLDKSKLVNEINQKFQDLCRLKLDNIEFLSRGSIPQSRKTLEDVRKWE
jgi:phenylacetate-coenzyme A ligase PaaK-like adenylate-forming protein